MTSPCWAPTTLTIPKWALTRSHVTHTIVGYLLEWCVLTCSPGWSCTNVANMLNFDPQGWGCASRRILDALQHASGPLIPRVEVDDIVYELSDPDFVVAAAVGSSASLRGVRRIRLLDGRAQWSVYDRAIEVIGLLC